MMHNTIVRMKISGILILFICGFAFGTSDNIYLKMAVKAHQEGWYSLSNKQLDKFFRDNEDIVNKDYAYLLYASNYIKLSDFEEAEKKLNKLMSTFPQSPFVKDGLSYIILIDLSREELLKAVSVYRQLSDKFGTDTDIQKQVAEVVFGKAVTLFNTEDFDKSKELFVVLNKQFQGNLRTAAVSYYLGLIAYRGNEFFEASGYFKSAIQQDLKGQMLADCLLKEGDCYFNNRNFEQAEQCYERVVREFSNTATAYWAYFQLSALAKRKNEYERSAKYLSVVADDAKDRQLRANALFELGALYMMQEKWLAAENCLTALIRDYPDSSLTSEALLKLGFVNFNKNNLSKAIDYFKKILSLPSSDRLKIQAHFGLGYAYYKKSMIPKTEKIWNKVLVDSPDSEFVPEILFLLGNAYFKKKNYGTSKKYFTRLIKDFPESSLSDVSYPTYIEILMAQKNYKDSVKACKKFLEHHQDENVSLSYGAALYHLNEFKKAKDVFEHISTQNPLYQAEILFYQGKINHDLGKTEQAKEKFLELITRYPNIKQWAEPGRKWLEQISQ